jgi:hypothetical protein
MDALVSSGTIFTDFAKMTGNAGLNHPIESFAEGARWTLKYITQNTGDFVGKTLKFEDPVNEGTRIIDVTITGSKPVFLEFKSVMDIPPVNFGRQFLNDLKNIDVKGLDQINWIFDGEKLKDIIKLSDKADVTKKFKEPIMKALDDMLENKEITDAMAQKLLPGRIENKAADIVTEIEKQFDNIFGIK